MHNVYILVGNYTKLYNLKLNNMREIKFRLGGTATDTGKWFWKYFTLDELMRTEFMKPEVYTARDEYIGLRDSKGVEIYEGDIYALHTGKTPTEKSIYYKGVVLAASSPWYGFTHKQIMSRRNKRMDYRYSPPGNTHCCTIIGNIYEEAKPALPPKE